MALGFYFDMTACIGCKTCQIACKDKNDLPLGTLYRNTESYETGEFPKPGAYHLSVSCNHCEKPACVEMCPTKAMYKSEDGVVLHDDSLCIGCGACVNACPYQVPKLLDTAAGLKSGKCDSCVSIRANGNLPQCVAACPMRALEFGDLDELKAAHPDAVNISELACVPASDTVPTTLVTPKAFALEKDYVEVII